MYTCTMYSVHVSANTHVLVALTAISKRELAVANHLVKTLMSLSVNFFLLIT